MLENLVNIRKSHSTSEHSGTKKLPRDSLPEQTKYIRTRRHKRRSSAPVIADLPRSYFMDTHQRMRMNVRPRGVLFWHRSVSENQGNSKNSESVFDAGSILDLSYLFGKGSPIVTGHKRSRLVLGVNSEGKGVHKQRDTAKVRS